MRTRTPPPQHTRTGMVHAGPHGKGEVGGPGLGSEAHIFALPCPSLRQEANESQQDWLHLTF